MIARSERPSAASRFASPLISSSQSAFALNAWSGFATGPRCAQNIRSGSEGDRRSQARDLFGDHFVLLRDAHLHADEEIAGEEGAVLLVPDHVVVG